jgi:hypothetical protein
MIDYIKAVVRDDKVLINRKIDWCETVNTNTGELLSTLGKISCFRINKKQSGLLILEGSLHKLSNGGAHNCNDFDYSSVVRSIGHLSHLLEVEPSSIDISNVECGVNLLTSEPSEVYINQAIGYRTKSFNVYNPDKHPDTIGKTSRHSQFVVKLYQKIHENNGSAHDILRYEMKAKKMEFLRKKGVPIRTLADLGVKDNLTAMGTVLINSFDNLFMIDKTRFDKIKCQEEKDVLYNFTTNWEAMCPQKTNFLTMRDYQQARKKYYKERDMFTDIVCKYGLNELHNEAKGRIEEKVQYMLN